MLREGPIPRFVHGVLEYLAGAGLIAAPFVLGFSGEAAPTALFIALGVLHLLVTIGTRFEREGRARGRRRQRDASPADAESGDLWEDSPPREPLSRPPPSQEG